MNQDNTPELTVPYILQQLEQFAGETSYVRQAIYELKNVRGRHEGATVAKAQAITDVVKAREETNQKLIELYGRIYQDLRGED